MGYVSVWACRDLGSACIVLYSSWRVCRYASRVVCVILAFSFFTDKRYFSVLSLSRTVLPLSRQRRNSKKVYTNGWDAKYFEHVTGKSDARSFRLA